MVYWNSFSWSLDLWVSHSEMWRSGE
jgi:hypothetical protein